MKRRAWGWGEQETQKGEMEMSHEFMSDKPTPNKTPEAESVLFKRIAELKEAKRIQCSRGNWDYDGYMHGMANGLIYAIAIMENEEPNFLNAPARFISEDVDKHKKETVNQDVQDDC